MERNLRKRKAWQYEEIQPLGDGGADWSHNEEWFFSLKDAKARSLECPPGHGWQIQRGTLTTYEEYVWESGWEAQYEFEGVGVACSANFVELVKTLD